MNAALRKSVTRYGALVEAIPLERPWKIAQRSPEYRTAFRYVSALFNEYGAEAVRTAIKDLLGWSGMARIQ